jgi:hypothetical protein
MKLEDGETCLNANPGRSCLIQPVEDSGGNVFNAKTLGGFGDERVSWIVNLASSFNDSTTNDGKGSHMHFGTMASPAEDLLVTAHM